MNPDVVKGEVLSPFSETEITDVAQAHFADDFKGLHVAAEDDQRRRGGWPDGMPTEFADNLTYQQVMRHLLAVKEVITTVDADIAENNYGLVRRLRQRQNQGALDDARRKMIDLKIEAIKAAAMERTLQEQETGEQAS